MNAVKEMIGKYVIVRAAEAGVFAGILTEKEGDEVVLTDCRRIWYWEGANSVSQLAVDGTLKPNSCKFTVPVNSITILRVAEIVPCTDKAEASIRSVKEWRL